MIRITEADGLAVLGARERAEERWRIPACCRFWDEILGVRAHCNPVFPELMATDEVWLFRYYGCAERGSARWTLAALIHRLSVAADGFQGARCRTVRQRNQPVWSGFSGNPGYLWVTLRQYGLDESYLCRKFKTLKYSGLHPDFCGWLQYLRKKDFVNP